jgi:hypothetical protein
MREMVAGCLPKSRATSLKGSFVKIECGTAHYSAQKKSLALKIILLRGNGKGPNTVPN